MRKIELKTKNIEEKWLQKKCKKAKEQIKDTISYIKNENVSFVNARGKETKINSEAEIIPLVVFENDSISEYEHLLRSHSAEGLTVNCMSLEDYRNMCIELVSPIEIVEYIKWRHEFYEKNGPVNLMVTETEQGFFMCKPQNKETLVHQYLYEHYGDEALLEDKFYFELFREYVFVLYEHTEEVSETDGCYEVVKFLAHLYRNEIKCFAERVEKSLKVAKEKKFKLTGTQRNPISKYAIVFMDTEQGEYISTEKLLPVAFEKQQVDKLLQVVTYWLNDNEYRIDFLLWQQNENI